MNYSDFQKNNKTKKNLYKIDFDQNFDKNKESWHCPFYNRKMAELMKKICDDSTIIYISENGDITVMKMKTSIYYYLWDIEKSKFITQKNKNIKKINNKKNINQDLKENASTKNNENSIENCSRYNKNLNHLLEGLVNESATIGILNDGFIMAIKTKSVMVTYRWNFELREFILQKSRCSNKVR